MTLPPEKDRIESHFLYQLGVLILAREAEGRADISDLDIEKLRQFFQRGWSWAKGEPCQSCGLTPESEED